ncbi:hypothetical protein P154DRAFT_251449 [Amniculicola lignicola CBS 123094]|uniref:Uncharacterized protein n=1 Tax=Amniculicola lignicola CBS 123094 TaxID=1392246 RepID=A0A6A5WGU7_9PLEO|nr:hypothetical protein P154DRAFT_251449 [Amniculicola lignicola CBS 123094]
MSACNFHHADPQMRRMTSSTPESHSSLTPSISQSHNVLDTQQSHQPAPPTSVFNVAQTHSQAPTSSTKPNPDDI